MKLIEVITELVKIMIILIFLYVIGVFASGEYDIRLWDVWLRLLIGFLFVYSYLLVVDSEENFRLHKFIIKLFKRK